MYRITLVLLFFSFYFSHQALGNDIQALGDDIIFSGEYRDIPFDRFISDIESKKDVHFFYRQEWISGITITAKGDSLSLTGVLQSNLAGTGLSFHIDNNRNIFLTLLLILLCYATAYARIYTYPSEPLRAFRYSLVISAGFQPSGFLTLPVLGPSVILSTFPVLGSTLSMLALWIAS